MPEAWENIVQGTKVEHHRGWPRFEVDADAWTRASEALAAGQIALAA